MECECRHEQCGAEFTHQGKANETTVCPICGRQQSPMLKSPKRDSLFREGLPEWVQRSRSQLRLRAGIVRLAQKLALTTEPAEREKLISTLEGMARLLPAPKDPPVEFSKDKPTLRIDCSRPYPVSIIPEKMGGES